MDQRFLFTKQITNKQIARIVPRPRHLTATIGADFKLDCGMGMVMATDTSTAIIELGCERLRHARRGRPVRSDNNPSVLPAIKMLIGEWYVDELGILTREITARD